MLVTAFSGATVLVLGCPPPDVFSRKERYISVLSQCKKGVFFFVVVIVVCFCIQLNLIIMDTGFFNIIYLAWEYVGI